jgi:hypothetical protein
MKKSLFIIIFLFLAAPLFVGAHSDSADGATGMGFMMMRSIEDRALGDELHEEMEDLMIKMMSGKMSDTETERMIELMEMYPGPHGMMMNRLEVPNSNSGQAFGFSGMMGPSIMGFFGGAAVFWWITQLLVWAVLILVIISLVKWVSKK